MGVLLSSLLESVLLIFSEPRGARHEARCIAPQPCIRLGPRGIQTMKQTFASGARLRSGRPILPTASKPGRSSGHRHLGSVLTACCNVVTGRQRTCLLLDLLELLTFPVAARHRPGLRRQSPCARTRSAAFWRAPRSSSFCAHPERFGPGTIKNRQASWIKPRRTRALPALASPFSRRREPLSSGDPVKPA